MKLQHPWWAEPERNLKWEVRCFDSHGRVASNPVYVCARSERAAVATGKYWMRVVGIKRRGTVVAKPYHPERDRELLARGFIKFTGSPLAHMPALQQERVVGFNVVEVTS